MVFYSLKVLIGYDSYWMNIITGRSEIVSGSDLRLKWGIFVMMVNFASGYLPAFDLFGLPNQILVSSHLESRLSSSWVTRTTSYFVQVFSPPLLLKSLVKWYHLYHILFCPGLLPSAASQEPCRLISPLLHPILSRSSPLRCFSRALSTDITFTSSYFVQASSLPLPLKSLVGWCLLDSASWLICLSGVWWPMED